MNGLKTLGLSLTRQLNLAKRQKWLLEQKQARELREPLVNVPSKARAKAGRIVARKLRQRNSLSMMDMGAPVGHKMPPADERTSQLFAAYRRRQENKQTNKQTIEIKNELAKQSSTSRRHY